MSLVRAQSGEPPQTAGLAETLAPPFFLCTSDQARARFGHGFNSIYVSDRGDVYTDPSTVNDGDGNYTGLVPADEIPDPYTGEPIPDELVLTEDQALTGPVEAAPPTDVSALDVEGLTSEEAKAFQEALVKHLG